MSKVVKTVANVATGGLLGAATGVFGATKDIAEGQAQFKGATRQTDKDAFKIKKADEKSDKADELGKQSKERSDQAQQDRRGLITQLQGQADGTAPSLAEAQLKSASDRNLAQQLAAAQSSRGGSAASRERQLLRNQASAGQELAQQSTEARLAERNQAQQLLGEQISQEQQLSDTLVQNYLAQGFNIEQAQQQALADLEKLETNQFLAAQGLTAASTEAAAGRQAGLVGGVLNAGGSIAAAAISDETAKTKIKKANNKDMLKALSNGTKKNSTKKASSKKASDKNMKKDEDDKKEKAKKQKLASELNSAFPTSTGDDGSSAGRNLHRSALSAISDEKAKKNIEKYGSKNIKKDFLDKLQAYTYEYKEPNKPGRRQGRQTSVMAQDLEKTEIGKNMVGSTEDGTKFVDYAKGYGAILAAQAHLNKRLDELESKKSKTKKRK